MIPFAIDLTHSSHKKIYEFILSAKQPSQQLAHSLDYLVKQSLSCSEHFSFLLHRINWFEAPFTAYRQHLFKIFRLYRSCGTQSNKVIYNIVIEGFFNAKSHKQSLACLVQIFGEGSHQKSILSSLKENYPHKLCSTDIHTFYLYNLIELCKAFPNHRIEFLEIIVENLTKFDTEVLPGDDWVHRPFPNDIKILEARESTSKNQLASKLDLLIMQVIEYLASLENDPTILDEVLLVFQNKVLPIKTTKNIQLIVFFLAEQNKNRANTFISFLLSNIFQSDHEQNWFRIFSQSNFYLFSYLLRSRTVLPKSVKKTFFMLVEGLHKKLIEIEEKEIDSSSSLKEMLQAEEVYLLILQTIIIIKIGHQIMTNDQDVNDAYQCILKQCRGKLHFHLFLKDQILEKIGVPQNPYNFLRLKFSNKFLPSTLNKTGKLFDSMMKIYGHAQSPEDSLVPSKLLKHDFKRMETKPEKEGEQLGRQKLHKGQTPVSHSAETVF